MRQSNGIKTYKYYHTIAHDWVCVIETDKEFVEYSPSLEVYIRYSC